MDEPASSPSLDSNSRAVRKLSSSVTVMAWRAKEMSQTSGMKSSPMPSTAQLPAVPSFPVFT